MLLEWRSESTVGMATCKCCWNGDLQVLLEWRPASAIGMATCKCCLILEGSWNDAVGVLPKQQELKVNLGG